MRRRPDPRSPTPLQAYCLAAAAHLRAQGAARRGVAGAAEAVERTRAARDAARRAAYAWADGPMGLAADPRAPRFALDTGIETFADRGPQ